MAPGRFVPPCMFETSAVVCVCVCGSRGRIVDGHSDADAGTDDADELVVSSGGVQQFYTDVVSSAGHCRLV